MVSNRYGLRRGLLVRVRPAPWHSDVAPKCGAITHATKFAYAIRSSSPPNPSLTMDHLPNDAIGIYTQSLRFSGFRIHFSTFLLSILKYFKVHISQLIPLGLNKVFSFEIVCRDLGIIPTVTLFWVFQSLCKQGDWFSFSKHRNTEYVCMDGPSSMKKWKNKFFLIDHRTIPDYLTWRHSHSFVFDDLPIDGYDQNDVEQLCAHLTRLREMNEAVLVRSELSSVWSNQKCDAVFRRKDDGSEMSIYDFMTLPTWENARVIEEPHEFTNSILQRVQNYTTAPISEGTPIHLPTSEEITDSQHDPQRAKKAKDPVKRKAVAPLVGPSEPNQPRMKKRLRKGSS
ncbi:hypothetical protein Tco_1438174 [Tanacetum coccineum]